MPITIKKTKKVYKKTSKKSQAIKKPKPIAIEKKQSNKNTYKINLNVNQQDNFLLIRKHYHEKVKYDISDATGMILFNGKLNKLKQTLNLVDLAPGVYFLNASFPDTNLKKSFRFIVAQQELE